MKAGRAGARAHDYKRHGTTTLFAALNTLDGTVISMCEPRHRHEEWLKFLRLIDRKAAKHLTLHLIVDNYGTHAHPAVQAWPAKHPRFVMHFTPTGAWWLNMVERFFRDISEKRISTCTSSTPSPSSGPPAPRTSWPRSHGAKAALAANSR